MNQNLRVVVVLVSTLLALVCLQTPGLAQVPQSREQIQLSYAPIVKQTAPAVVNIFTKTVVRERRVSPLFDDPLFRRFFGDGFGFGGRTRERTKNSLGSGVVIDPSGLIVTNNHVIEGADEINVVLADRREFVASLIGTDEKTDLALLRVTTSDPLPYLEFRDSDSIEVGDLVLAIGNPFGVGQTVTSGIVSGVARTQVGVTDIGSFIQTDAAINPGNSGGALITMDGRLAGINTAIFSRTGGSLGIGFAAPANMVRFVIDALRTGGRVVRPWLGAFGQPVTSDLAREFRLDRPGGVLINEVWPDGPADRAGIMPGDVVRSVDGKPINDPAELKFRFGSLPIGGEALIGVIREDGPLEIGVELARAPEHPPRQTTILQGSHPLAGARVANMSPALAEEEDLDDLRPGVVVLNIARGSPAARIRLARGDRVLKVNGTPILLVDGLAQVLERTTGRWEMTFDRKGRQISLTVEQ